MATKTKRRGGKVSAKLRAAAGREIKQQEEVYIKDYERAVTKALDEQPTCGLSAEVIQTELGEKIELRAFSGVVVRRIYFYCDRATSHNYETDVQATYHAVPTVRRMGKKPREAEAIEA